MDVPEESLLDVNWRECTMSRSHGHMKGHLRVAVPSGGDEAVPMEGGCRAGPHPVAPGLAFETLMCASHNKAHAMKSRQRGKKNPIITTAVLFA